MKFKLLSDDIAAVSKYCNKILWIDLNSYKTVSETKIELSPTIIDYFDEEDFFTTDATTKMKKRRRQKNKNYDRWVKKIVKTFPNNATTKHFRVLGSREESEVEGFFVFLHIRIMGYFRLGKV